MITMTEEDSNASVPQPVSQMIQLPVCIQPRFPDTGDILIRSVVLNQSLEPPRGRIIAVDGLSQAAVHSTIHQLEACLTQIGQTRYDVQTINRVSSSIIRTADPSDFAPLLDTWDRITQTSLPSSFNVKTASFSQSLLDGPPANWIYIVAFSPMVSLLRVFSFMEVPHVRSGD